MKFIIAYFFVIGICYLSSTVEAVAQTVNKCVMNCNEDKSCRTRLQASEWAHPGDIRQGSCDRFGKCSAGYPVHCQKCSELCKSKRATGVYETAVITLSVAGNKKLADQNKREKVTCNNLKSTPQKAADRELIGAAKDPIIFRCLLPKINNNIEAKTNYGYTLLILASSVGQLDNVKALLELNADINAENDQGVTAFILAAEKGHLEVVKELLKKQYRLNIEKADKKGRTALIWAAMKGNLEVVKYLVEKENANPNAQDVDGQTPLVLASKNNHNAVTNYLSTISGGRPSPGRPGPERPGPASGANNDALINEALKGNTQVVMSLINQNNKDYQDKHGRTVLIAAAEGGHAELVSQLIGFGVDVRLANSNDEMTALHLVALNGHLQNVKDLIKRGAEINAEARYNFKRRYTPIILAAKEGHKDIVSYLISKNARVGAETEDGYNAVLWAAQNRHTNVVKTLLDDSYSKRSEGVANLFVRSFSDIRRLQGCGK